MSQPSSFVPDCRPCSPNLTIERSECYLLWMLQAQKSPQKAAPSVAASQWTGPLREHAVQRMFTSIARFYDLNNSVLSFGLHHRWKRQAAQLVPAVVGGRAIDIGAGTGDLAILVAKRYGAQGKVLAADLNAAMLGVGKKKISGKPVHDRIACLRMNAEQLACPDGSLDAATAGFCIRNVGDLMKSFHEIHRVLKPGGRFVCLEFSRPVRPWLRKLYDWYSFRVLPRIGTAVARDGTGVYDYLPASIRTFPDQEALKELLLKAGFHQVTYRNLSGGIVAIHVAIK